MASPLLRFAGILAGIVTGLDYSATPNHVLRYLPDWSVTFWPTKGKPMTPQIPKPEWFQLTEADAIQPRPRINRVTRMLALSTPLLVLGMGYMVAQGSTGQDLPARSIQVASAPAPAQVSNSALATTATNPSTPQARVVPSSFTTGIKSPLTKPTGGSDDDEIVSAPIGSSVAPGISVMPTGGSDDDSDEGVEEDD